MAESFKPFRYLVPNGTQFDFLRNAKPVSRLSMVLLALSLVALFVNKEVRGSMLNWTIDFKGGTEVIVAFRDKVPADSPPGTEGKPRVVQPGKLRDTLQAAGKSDVEISDITWTEDEGGQEREVQGVVIRTPEFGAVDPNRSKQVETAIREKLAAKEIDAVRWSGDTLHLRAKQTVTEADLAPVFQANGLELKPLDTKTQTANATIDEGLGEYNMTFAAWGVDREYERLLESALADTDAVIVQSYGVGAKAGDELFYDGLKAIVYAMFLIMLYLVFRFDIRYAPGAIKATLHDAVLVLGVLAVTWTPFSLSTLAALLTVVGYSVNDTAIVFDRIRENMVRLKDKRVEKIVNLSLNEVLGRSILTSLFVFSVTLMMNIFGDGLVRNFAFVLNVGVIIGAASTIFLSAPVFVWIHNRYFTGARPTRGARSAAIAAEP
jgi:preprotein translocase subunit SecF